MAKVTYVQTDSNSLSSTRYAPMVNTSLRLLDTTQALGESEFKVAGTLSRFFVIGAATAAGVDTVDLYNATDASTLIGLEEVTNTLTEDNITTAGVVTGKKYTFRKIRTSNPVIYATGWTFEPDTGHYTTIGMFGAGQLSENSQIRYLPAQGEGARNTTDTLNYKPPIDIDCIAKNFSVYVYVNGRGTSVTYRVRKNSSNSSISIVVAAGVTGLFENLSDTESFNGDTINYSRQVTTGGGSIGESYISVELHSTLNQHPMIGLKGGAGRVTPSSSTPVYFTPFGGLNTSGLSNEALVGIPIGHPGNASIFKCRVTGNTSNGGSIKIRKNGVDVATITISASTNNEFSNLVTDFDFVEGDLISASAETSGSGSFQVIYVTMVITQSIPSGQRVFIIS